MNLQSFLKNDVDKSYVFYKDEKGIIKNICYQNKTFFRLLEGRKVEYLNPLKVMNTLAILRHPESAFTLVGKGQYYVDVNIKENYIS